MNFNKLASRFRFVVLLLVAIYVASAACPAWAAKNVILMISDGAGFNVFAAADMYEGKLGKQIYDQSGWIKLGCTTYPLTQSGEPTGDEKQDARLLYDPAKAWDATPVGDKLGKFAGYKYLKSTATDSAAAATALATGRKTYNSAINWSSDDQPMLGQTISEIAKSYGKKVGIVTSVTWSHATPAGLGGAHNRSRSNCDEIAREMLDSTWLDVIMGSGHPGYDNDGQPLPEFANLDYKPVGGQQTWYELATGELPWKLIESKEDFETLAAGETPEKVVGTARVSSTLQQKRGSGQAKIDYTKAKGAKVAELPMIKTVPSLAAMAKGALNCLDDDPDGFFLMIEGGAVDWANHANQPARMIEEQVDFIRAVEAVVAWIESHGGWNETLLIITADHDCGLIWGPNSDKQAFDPLVDRGPGKMPGLLYHTGGHSNSLVPLFARGPGSESFTTLMKGLDPRAAKEWRFSGNYVDNTDIFQVMKGEVSR